MKGYLNFILLNKQRRRWSMIASLQRSPRGNSPWTGPWHNHTPMCFCRNKWDHPSLEITAGVCFGAKLYQDNLKTGSNPSQIWTELRCHWRSRLGVLAPGCQPSPQLGLPTVDQAATSEKKQHSAADQVGLQQSVGSIFLTLCHQAMISFER